MDSNTKELLAKQENRTYVDGLTDALSMTRLDIKTAILTIVESEGYYNG